MKIIRYMLMRYSTDTQTGVETGPYLTYEGSTLASMKGRRTVVLASEKRAIEASQRYGVPRHTTHRYEIHKLEGDTTLIS